MDSDLRTVAGMKCKLHLVGTYFTRKWHSYSVIMFVCVQKIPDRKLQLMCWQEWLSYCVSPSLHLDLLVLHIDLSSGKRWLKSLCYLLLPLVILHSWCGLILICAIFQNMSLGCITVNTSRCASNSTVYDTHSCLHPLSWSVYIYSTIERRWGCTLHFWSLDASRYVKREV